MLPLVHVIGASGRSGAALCAALLARGQGFIPVVREPARWRATGLPGAPRRAEIEDQVALAGTLADAAWVVSTAHARHAGRVIAAAPAQATLVFLGSTRKFTRWPDAHGDGVLAGEQALLGSGRNGVMLHPSMIYGAQGENNVRRLAALLRVLPVVPLPAGGRALVQPINQADVTRAILASLDRPWHGPHSLVVAGPRAICYRDFVAGVALAFEVAPRPVLSVPGWLLIALAAATQHLPRLSGIGPAEIRRLLEDRAFDIAPMQAELGITPISLQAGLSAMRRSTLVRDRPPRPPDRQAC